jgi:hypothetical protein
MNQEEFNAPSTTAKRPKKKSPAPEFNEDDIISMYETVNSPITGGAITGSFTLRDGKIGPFEGEQVLPMQPRLHQAASFTPGQDLNIRQLFSEPAQPQSKLPEPYVENPWELFKD